MLKRFYAISAMSIMASLAGICGVGMTAYADASPLAQAQQTGVCTGRVIDEQGEPVIGATVLVKGTKQATATDIDGNFELKNVKSGAALVISYVGCGTQEVVWTGGPVETQLKSDLQNLDEVVVVGYGKQKKVNVTGAVSMVNSEAFDARPVTNAAQALQGAVPGLNLSVGTGGGELNQKMNINIRGAGSIGSGSVDSPLMLIDGIEGDITTLNPNDIESVSVLKDAASASIYGARAAFGVILITTKNGKQGKVNVNYSGDVRFATATQLPNMVNSLDWAYYFNEANINAGNSQIFSDETIANMVAYQEGKFTDPKDPKHYGVVRNEGNNRWSNYGSAFANTNWFDEHYKKNVPSTQHNLSLSGGNEKFNWLLSGSFLLNNGLIRHGHDERDRYTINAKIGAQLAKWARVDYNAKWTRDDYQRPQYMEGLFFHNIARRWPSCPVIDPNGHYQNEMEIEELENGGKYKTNVDYFTQQLRFTITPLEGWNIVAEGALRTTNSKATKSLIPIYYWDCDNVPFLRNSDYGTVSNVIDERYRQNYYAVNVFTDYTRSFSNHNLKVLLGLNFEKYSQDSLTGRGYNLTTTDKPYLSQAQQQFTVSDAYWHRAVAGYFGRINYDYDGRYLLEVNLRYDGSSRFLARNRWAFFPSFSAGWNIARENFWENLRGKISTLKIRGSWGSLGNTSSSYNSFADWYPFYQQQAISAASTQWLINGQKQNASSLPGIVNTTMTWETVQTLDFGFDLAALNNRLTVTFDWFRRTTKDMIGPAPVLGSVLGVDAPATNNCDMRSQGWELEIGWRDHVGDFTYGARFNISDSRSTILNYPYDGAFENQNVGGYYNGKVLGEIWGYECEGIASSNDQMKTWLEKNQPNWGSNWQAGDVMYRDLNGDGKVTSGASTLKDHGDLKVIGNSNPRYRFGLNINAGWKGIDFSVFFQGVMKMDYLFGSDQAYFWGAQGNMWQSAVFAEHLDYWRDENSYGTARFGVNTDAYYPRPYFGGINKNHQSMDRYVQDASYIRCKNIQLGYSLPKNVIGKIGMTNCRIYVSCDNLFTGTKMSKVFDPEVLQGGWGAGKTYPLQRTWAIGASISF